MQLQKLEKWLGEANIYNEVARRANEVQSLCWKMDDPGHPFTINLKQMGHEVEFDLCDYPELCNIVGDLLSYLQEVRKHKHGILKNLMIESLQE